MARKNYQIKAKTAEAWQRIHDELILDGSSEVNVPSRKCTCKEDKTHSPTRGTYQLSAEEVAELRSHPDIDYVALDDIYHPEERAEIIPDGTRFASSVKNYRSLYDVTPPVEVKNSLMATTGQLNQGVTNWVHVSALSGSSPAMSYWASLPLLTEYGVYKSVPTDKTQEDPHKDDTLECENTFAISTAAFYQLEISIDGELGEVEWAKFGGTPQYYPLSNKFNSYVGVNNDSVSLNPRVDQSNPKNHKYQVINLGYLTADTYTIKARVKNGDYHDPATDNWNYNPGGIAWRLMQYKSSEGSNTSQAYLTGADSEVTHTIPRTSPTTAEKNRTGYQLLRCQSGASNTWTDSKDVKTSNINYTNDGYDTDVIVIDDGTWHGHPEFCTDDSDPSHYIPGNVLARHGTSGALDLFFDAPYYLDPDWFNADNNRLEVRWDGTRVPTDAAARSWWTSSSSRSSTFLSKSSGTGWNRTDTLGSSNFTNYARSAACGTKTTTPTDGDHGTPVASLIYGKNFGWAFNCNKWSIDYNRMNAEGYWGIVKLFHNFKPDNPKFADSDSPFYDNGNYKKDPTIVNCSWGRPLWYTNPIGLDASVTSSAAPYTYLNNGGTYNYRGTAGTYPAQTVGQGFSTPKFAHRGSSRGPARVQDGNTNLSKQKHTYVSGAYWVNYGQQYFEPVGGNAANLSTGSVGQGDPNSENTDIREVIDAGVVVVFSTGNTSNYYVSPTDEDYNNTVDGFHVNRLAFPQQISYDKPMIIIGAIGDSLRDDWDLTGDAPFKEQASSQFDVKSERLPAGDPYMSHAEWDGNNSEYGPSQRDYSSRGSAIDFYAPSETLAASVKTDSSNLTTNVWMDIRYQRLETHPTGGKTYQDMNFGGTSAAAPVASGLIACALQQNRGWTPSQVRSNLKSAISAEGTSFYRGYRPGNSPDDPKWMGTYSTFGSDVRIIKEYTGVTSKSAHPSIVANSGLNTAGPDNEQFTITENSASVSHKVKIHGIREFTESDTSIILKLKNGYYPIEVSTDETNHLVTGQYQLRVDPTSNKKLQISDNSGGAWDDFEIEVVNGRFVCHGVSKAYYVQDVTATQGLPSGGGSTTATYSLTANSYSVNEGDTIITACQTTNVSQGTTIYWQLTGSITAADFTGAALTGSSNVSASGYFQFLHTLKQDTLTEGTENITIKLYSDSARTTQVGNSISITVVDTSTTNTGGGGGSSTAQSGEFTVTKAGPFFSSGDIRWSALRYNFKETQSGAIKCSELWQNTNINDTDPIVPHCTENDQVKDSFTLSGGKYTATGTATNWKASLMRDSVKRYTGTCSGTYVELDMGLYTASGNKGIDWDGQGVADAAGSTNGNYTRNVQKIINLKGSCVSTDTGTNGLVGGGGVGNNKKPAAMLVLPNPMKAINTRINNTGSIIGAGGLGGFYSTHQTNSDPGKDGGPALQLFHEGNINGGIKVHNTGQIYGGGGSGEQGEMGYPGAAGQCTSSGSSTSVSIGGYFTTCPGGGSAGCGGAQFMGTVCFWQIDCDGDGSFDGSICASVCETTSYWTNNYGSSTTPVPGIGGAGGNGEGHNQPRQNGFQGTNPVQAQCNNGGSLEGGQVATGGGAGGNGGAYGQPGSSTLGIPGDGGRGGSAICGKNYTLTGSTGSANIKGAIDLLCDGAAAPKPPAQGLPVLTVTMTRGQHVRFNRPASHLLVTSVGSNGVSNNNSVSFILRDICNDQAMRDYALRDLIIYDKDNTTTEIKRCSYNHPSTTDHTMDLLPGVYPLKWIGLHPYNTATAPFGYDINNDTYVPDDRGGFGSDPTEFGHNRRNPSVIVNNDQQIDLWDTTNPDINRRFLLLPPAGGSSNITPWERSWDTNRGHDNATDFPAINNLWHQYMRDLAVTTSNIDTQTSASFGSDDHLQDGIWEFDVDQGKTGIYTIKARSDNNAKFYWGTSPDITPTNALGFMETTPYDSHGANFGVGQAPTGFTELGRIWPYASEGGNGQTNWFNGWSRQLNGSGQPMQGCTYWQLNLTTVGKIYLLVRLVNQPINNPSDPADNDAWATNPAGVAFEVFDPNQNRVAKSTDIIGKYGTFGVPEASWSVTNIRIDAQGTPVPPDYMQATSSALTTTGTRSEFLSDNQFNDSVPEGVLSGTSKFKPQSANTGSGGMKYTYVANNTSGSVSKDITIN